MEETVDYRIQLVWDDEASVWIATSKDVPGLVLESGSLIKLLNRVRIAVPEMLELNQSLQGGFVCP